MSANPEARADDRGLVAPAPEVRVRAIPIAADATRTRMRTANNDRDAARLDAAARVDAADEASEAVADSAAEAARVTILPDASERLADRNTAAPEAPKATNVRSEDSAADLGRRPPPDPAKLAAMEMAAVRGRSAMPAADRLAVVARAAVPGRSASPAAAKLAEAEIADVRRRNPPPEADRLAVVASVVVLGLVAPAWTERARAGARVIDLPLDRDSVEEIVRVVARTAVRERLATPVNATDNAVESAALRTASLVATVAREAVHDSAALLGLEAPPRKTCKRPKGRVEEAARKAARPDVREADANSAASLPLTEEPERTSI